MSFTGNLIKIIKKFDRHGEHYILFTEIIGKLQPIAFLISASLVLSVFFLTWIRIAFLEYMRYLQVSHFFWHIWDLYHIK